MTTFTTTSACRNRFSGDIRSVVAVNVGHYILAFQMFEPLDPVPRLAPGPAVEGRGKRR